MADASEAEIRVPSAFIDLAEQVVCHADPERFARLHNMQCRLQNEPRLLTDPADGDVARLFAMQKAVRRDSHKMKAFVRFKEVASEAGRRRFAAWFEPDHFIVELTAPFFARRFADMDWVIATPAVTAKFTAGNLSFSLTDARPPQVSDAADALWTTYYSAIFNPARLKIAAMKREMPVKYWRNLPEARLIPSLVAEAETRAIAMQSAGASLPSGFAEKARAPMRTLPDLIPDAAVASFETLEEMRAAAAACTRCPLHANATQTVFGEGSPDATLVFVGEQPGDKEDLQGRPFVGPAGQLFDDCLGEAGIDRAQAYVTNAVKHFKFEPRGKFRLHKKPNTSEIEICKWWLAGELKLLTPKVIVALGGTAAQALTGSAQGILKRRGHVETLEDGSPVFITVHPSSLLRLPDEDMRISARAQFVRDLRAIKDLLIMQG